MHKWENEHEKDHSHLAPLALCAGGWDVAPLGRVSVFRLDIIGDSERVVARLEDLERVKYTGSWWRARHCNEMSCLGRECLTESVRRVARTDGQRNRRMLRCSQSQTWTLG